MFQLGSTLREARTRQGLELRDAAEATRIRVKFLAALEGERFDELPAEVYARAFLRTYAEFLGLDGDVYVARLNSRIEAQRPPPPPPPEPRLTLPSLDWRVIALLGGAAVVILVSLLAWHYGSGAQARRQSAVRSQVASAKKTIAHRPTAATRASSPAFARLVLVAARGDCWLAIRAGSRDGPVLDEGMLREGAAVRVAANRLWLRIGAPWNLDARLNGRALRNLPADTSNVFVTAAGLEPAAITLGALRESAHARSAPPKRCPQCQEGVVRSRGSRSFSAKRTHPSAAILQARAHSGSSSRPTLVRENPSGAGLY
jgi:cytoskeleton protein RodZ